MMEYPCVACAREVRPRQHAVACDVCEGWQHRTCGTGISAKQYKAAVRGNKDIPFECCRCKRKDVESQPSEVVLKTTPTKTDARPRDIPSRTPECDLPTSVEDILNELEPLPTPEPVRTVPAPASQRSPAKPVSPDSGLPSTTVNRALFMSPDPILRYDMVNLNTTRVVKAHSPTDLARTLTCEQSQERIEKQRKSTFPYLGLSFNLESDDDSPSEDDLNKAFYNCSLADLNDTKNEPVTYRVIKQGSLMGKDLLTDSIGYTYVIKRHSSRRTRWRCSVRTQYWTCRANVIQTGATFTPGDEIHSHFPQIQKSKDAELIVKIRDKVENKLSTSKKSARTIVKETMAETGRETPLSERKLQTLMRRTNNIKAKHRKHEVYKENAKIRACDSTEYVEIAAPEDGPAKLHVQIFKKRSHKPDNPTQTVLQQKQVNGKIYTFRRPQTTAQSNSSITHTVTRTTLPAPQKRPQHSNQSTSTMVANTTQPQSIVQSSTRTGVIAPKSNKQELVKRPQPSIQSTSTTFTRTTLLQSTGQPTTSTIASKTNRPLPYRRPHPTSGIMTPTSTILPLEKRPQPTVFTVQGKATTDIPSTTNPTHQPSFQPVYKLNHANKSERPISTVTPGPSQKKIHHRSTINRQTAPNTERVAPSKTQTRQQTTSVPAIPQNTATKKRKTTMTTDMTERFQQLLKRPRYERTARSIVEDSLRDQGYDPTNPPPFINIKNMIRVANRCRRRALISECDRQLSERLGDVNKTLRPPTKVPMEVDSDSLQGKEEDRYV